MDRIELYYECNKNDIDKRNTLLMNQGIHTEIVYLEQKNMYCITVKESEYDLAKSLLQAQFHEELLKENEDAPKEKVHMKSSEKYKDLKSSSFAFLTVGIFLIVFFILKLCGFIPINTSGFYDIFINIVLAILCIGILIFGAHMYRSSKALTKTIKSETAITDSVIEWFTTMYSKEKIDSEILIEPSAPPYFDRIEFIQSTIKNQFADLEPSFIEYLAEELYQIIYEKN